MTLVGREDIVAKEWKLPERVKHVDEVDEMILTWTSSKTQKEIEEVLISRDIPCAPVMELLEVARHPHTEARNMLNELNDMHGKTSGILGVVPKLLGTQGKQEWGMMQSGAFNQEIYGKLLGFTDEEIAKCKKDGII